SAPGTTRPTGRSTPPTTRPTSAPPRSPAARSRGSPPASSQPSPCRTSARSTSPAPPDCASASTAPPPAATTSSRSPPPTTAPTPPPNSPSPTRSRDDDRRVSLAPGVPADYYAQIRAVEDSHWWYRSMRELSVALLGPGLAGADAVLDAGCGSGGFLHWLVDRGSFRSVAGIDVAGAAVELARKRVPGADLRVAPLAAIPFDDASFDLVICNDVLQHVDESELARSLAELRRVLRPEGRLLLRTNGSRKLRRERSDWRAYDRVTLRSQLEAAGFVVERVTHANLVPS